MNPDDRLTLAPEERTATMPQPDKLTDEVLRRLDLAMRDAHADSVLVNLLDAARLAIQQLREEKDAIRAGNTGAPPFFSRNLGGAEKPKTVGDAPFFPLALDAPNRVLRGITYREWLVGMVASGVCLSVWGTGLDRPPTGDELTTAIMAIADQIINRLEIQKSQGG